MKKDKNNNNFDLPSDFKITGVISTDKNHFANEDIIIDYNKTPLILIRDVVPFPNMPVPVQITEEYDRILIEEAEKENKAILLATELDPAVNEFDFPVTRLTHFDGTSQLISTTGVLARVVKLLDMPDGTTTALLGAMGRAKVVRTLPETNCYYAVTQSCEEIFPEKDEQTVIVTFKEIEKVFKDFFKDNENPEEETSNSITFALNNHESPFQRFDFIAMNAPMDWRIKLTALSKDSLKERAMCILKGLRQSKQLFELKKSIYNQTTAEISQQQKEHFLQTEMRMIREELNNGIDSDNFELSKRAAEKKWSKTIEEHFNKELQKLGRFAVNSPDYAIQYAYLDALLSLPWDVYKQDEINLPRLQEDLDKDHFGLEKVKERIIEHIAVLKLKDDMRSPIICLVGPPGVGKTSLCRSIADSIHREYVRVSLGGLHDEAEIRGHRKTYIGAMPGRIIAALQKINSSNPVFVLDEIDKIGKDYKGDPAQALLEVLDPEQNSTFHDNYLDVDYDLSKVMFISTANTVATISAPLLDRMEIIDVSGYILDEKVEIARKHLIPKLLVDHGFKKNEIKFDDESIKVMIESYTRESGVRKLEKVISRVLRKIAVKKASGLKYPKTVKAKLVKELLGKEEVLPEVYEDTDVTGVVTGLAWTAAGGEILYIESSLSKGKGELTLTGNLGDVMKESATLALQWIRSHAEELRIDPERFQNTAVHIHVPEGAVPKDGPSAGITMVTSLVSSFTDRKVKPHFAMTGEITLRGKVLPVGGIKEKILAARRAGIKDIILSEQNRKDIEEIKEIYLEGLSFHYVSSIMEVLETALER